MACGPRSRKLPTRKVKRVCLMRNQTGTPTSPAAVQNASSVCSLKAECWASTETKSYGRRATMPRSQSTSACIGNGGAEEPLAGADPLLE